MPWKVIQRRLGRAGGEKERHARQRKWDREYGEGYWEIGYKIDGAFVPQHQAIDLVYDESYRLYFENHPEALQELVQLAKSLRNPHARATSGVDLQVPAITRYLREHDVALCGTEVVDIGSWQGKRSHAISERLSPLQIPCAIAPNMTLEQFWQSRKCLAIWED